MAGCGGRVGCLGKPVSSLDLARLCGVSQGTVDRALHGRGRIASATRKRILAVAKSYGYAPNPVARELLSGVSPFIGAVVPTVNSIFFMHILEELHQALRPHRLRLIISPADDAVEAREIVADFHARRLRGIVIVPPEERMGALDMAAGGTPAVSLVNPCGSAAIPFVGPDEERTGTDGVRYLVSRGHRRILFLSYPRRSWAIRSRERGYARAMRQHGLRPCIVTRLAEGEFVREFHRYRPTAVFCHNDWLAIGAVRLLGRQGLQVPEHVSVLGIDNSPVLSELYPGLTTMEYPVKDVVDRAVALLCGGRSAGRVGASRIVERTTVKQI